MKGKPTPVASALVGFTFTSVNGYIQGRYFSHYLTYDLWWFADPRFILGHLLFLFGMAANIHSDTVLKGLRKPGETGYKIPHGTGCLFALYPVCLFVCFCLLVLILPPHKLSVLFPYTPECYTSLHLSPSMVIRLSLQSPGGLFDYVSGANYFSECLEWFGYALCSWSWPGLVMAVFTTLFLGARALQHHR